MDRPFATVVPPSGWSNLTHTPLVDSLLPSRVRFPIYHFHRDDVIPGVPDPVTSLFAPFVAYWLVSGLFHLADVFRLLEPYRLHEPEEVTKRNRVTPWQVVKAVLVQQLIQTGLGIAYLDETVRGKIVGTDYREEMRPYAAVLAKVATVVLGQEQAQKVLTGTGVQLTQWLYWWAVPAVQFLWACFVMDTWQYFWHRYFHTNRFLYRHIHSVHHRLYVPYAFGALYNHPVEGFIFDSAGAIFAHTCAFMTVRQAIVLFTFSTAKTVDDHSGFKLLWDPLQFFFHNNSDYHDIHHQQFGIKKNFAQPYFTNWDRIMGTHMSREEAEALRSKKKRPLNGHSTPNGKELTTGKGGAMVPHTDGRDPLVRKRRGTRSGPGDPPSEED